MNVSRVRVRMYHTDFVGGAFHGRYFDLFESQASRGAAFIGLGACLVAEAFYYRKMRKQPEVRT